VSTGSDRGGRPVIVPLLVLEAPPAVLEAEAAKLQAAGWTLVDGLSSPAPRSDRPIVRRVRVATERDAEDTLLAAIEGDGLLVEATADRALVDRLVDDLRRLGPVDHRLVDAADAPPEVPPESRAILGLLAEGHSLGEAAGILGLSRRTADRRLDAARKALGVTRTTEAIARATSLGWLRPGGPG
jgi:DNA-binding NarL/FixJ family response regulator